jgi:hypothetical protein
VEAGFAAVDPGERRLANSGALTRQVPYVVAVVESTLAEVASSQMPGDRNSRPALKPWGKQTRFGCEGSAADHGRSASDGVSC